MPNMSNRGPASTGAHCTAGAEQADVAYRVCEALLSTADAQPPQHCPFQCHMLGEGLQVHAALHAEMHGLYTASVQTDGCSCKGTTKRTLPELYSHARDVSRSDGENRKECHRQLCRFLETRRPEIKRVVDEELKAKSQLAAPAVFTDTVSWPPVLMLHTHPECEYMVKFPQRLKPLLRNISAATKCVPPLQCPACMPMCGS